MRTIAVVNMKGGVGKTTTAVSLASGLARRNQTVLLLDADPQGNVGHALNLHPIRTIRELMTSDGAVEDVIIRDVRPNLDVIGANTTAFGLEQQLAGAPQRETILNRRLRRLPSYDYLIIDSSPSMGLLTYNALLCADEVIVPVGMEPMALIGARQTMNGIAEVRELWPDRRLEVRAVLPICVNPTTRATRATIAALEHDEEFSRHLYRRGIRQCIDLTYAAASRQTIWEYAPGGRAAEDYSALLDFIASDASATTNTEVLHA
jgi:chromosome partitioning protein